MRAVCCLFVALFVGVSRLCVVCLLGCCLLLKKKRLSFVVGRCCHYRCSLFFVCWLLCVGCCWLTSDYCLLLVHCRVLFVVCNVLLAVSYCVLLAVCRLLVVVCRLLFGAGSLFLDYLFFVAWCLLRVVCCLCVALFVGVSLFVCWFLLLGCLFSAYCLLFAVW